MRHLLEKLRRECEILNQRKNFITDVVTGKLKIGNRKKAEILKDLKKNPVLKPKFDNKPNLKF